jgi:hypothetical protein
MLDKKFSLVFVTLIFPMSSWAGEVVKRTCGVGLINTLHQLESKTDTKLEIFEFRLTKNPAEVFEGQTLIKKKATLSKMFTPNGLYRTDPVARKVFKQFSETTFVGNVADSDLPSLLKPNTYYTYAVDDEKIRFAQTKPGILRNYGSKHIMIRDPDTNLRLAGEFWVDDKAKFHFDGSSGTFVPTNEQTAKGIKFFQDQMGIKDAEVHYFNPPAKTVMLTEPTDKSFSRTKAYLISRGVIRDMKMVKHDEEHMNALQEINNSLVTIKDHEGHDLSYKVLRTNTIISEEHLFDTPDSALGKKGAFIKVESVYESNQKVPFAKDLLKGSAVETAKKYGADASKLTPVASDKIEDTEYLLYASGKDKPEYRINLISVDSKTGQTKEKQFYSQVEPITENSRDLSESIRNKLGLEIK